MSKAADNRTPTFLHQEEEDPLMKEEDKPFTPLQSLPVHNFTVL